MVSILPRVGLLETTETNSFCIATSTFSVGHPMKERLDLHPSINTTEVYFRAGWVGE